MNKLDFKGKILVVLFILFFCIAAVMFNFEQMVLAIGSFIIAIIFVILLILYHKKKFRNQ